MTALVYPNENNNNIPDPMLIMSFPISNWFSSAIYLIQQAITIDSIFNSFLDIILKRSSPTYNLDDILYPRGSTWGIEESIASLFLFGNTFWNRLERLWRRMFLGSTNKERKVKGREKGLHLNTTDTPRLYLLL